MTRPIHTTFSPSPTHMRRERLTALTPLRFGILPVLVALAVWAPLSACGSSAPPAPLPQPEDTAPAVEPAPEPAPEPYTPEVFSEPTPDPLVGVPAPGRDRVRWVQSRLNDRGYACGGVDGRLGPNTRRCIRAFRVDHDLSDTPDVDDDLLALLNTPR